MSAKWRQCFCSHSPAAVAHPGELACSVAFGPKSWPAASAAPEGLDEPGRRAWVACSWPEAAPRSSEDGRLASAACPGADLLDLCLKPRRGNLGSVAFAWLGMALPKPRREGAEELKLKLRGGLRLCRRPAGESCCVVWARKPRWAGAVPRSPEFRCRVKDASMGAKLRESHDEARANGHCDAAASSGQTGTVPRLQVNTISAGRPSIDADYGGNRTSRSRLRSEPFFIGVAGMGHFSSAGAWLG